MSIQDSKSKLQSLYDDLKKEIEGEFTSTGVYVPPTATSYYIKAKKLVDEAIKYSEQDNSLNKEAVLHTLKKEVSYVKNYDGKRKTVKKRQVELESLMRKATCQLYIDLCPLIKDN